MRKWLKIKTDTVNEYIKQALVEPTLRNDEKQVCFWLQEFIQQKGGPFQEDIKETTKQIKSIIPSAQDIYSITQILDFQMSFRGNNVQHIVEVRRTLTKPFCFSEFSYSPFVSEMIINTSGKKGLVYYIFQEIYLALCKNDSRYKQEVTGITSNLQLIIGAIAGHIATKFNTVITVTSALTAVSLWLILKLGRNSFCKYWSSTFKNKE